MALWTVILFVLALCLIIKGADWFVSAAIEMAEGFHIPKVLIGATLVSMATVAPEFFVSVMASAMGQVEMAVGNAVGSPIANIGLILGGCVCFAFIPVSEKLLKRDCMMMLAAVFLLFIVSFNGTITRPISLSLLFLLYLYVRYSMKQAKKARAEWRKNGAISKTDFNLRREVFLFSIGSVMVIIGSRLLIWTGTEMADYFGVSEGIIGLTFVAFGTSLPELSTAVTAVLKGHKDLTIGNIIGANILNVLLVIGVSGFIRPLPIDNRVHFFAIPVLLVLSSLIIIFGWTKKGLLRWAGGIFLTIYSIYIVGLFLL